MSAPLAAVETGVTIEHALTVVQDAPRQVAQARCTCTDGLFVAAEGFGAGGLIYSGIALSGGPLAGAVIFFAVMELAIISGHRSYRREREVNLVEKISKEGEALTANANKVRLTAGAVIDSSKSLEMTTKGLSAEEEQLRKDSAALKNISTQLEQREKEYAALLVERKQAVEECAALRSQFAEEQVQRAKLETLLAQAQKSGQSREKIIEQVAKTTEGAGQLLTRLRASDAAAQARLKALD